VAREPARSGRGVDRSVLFAGSVGFALEPRPSGSPTLPANRTDRVRRRGRHARQRLTHLFRDLVPACPCPPSRADALGIGHRRRSVRTDRTGTPAPTSDRTGTSRPPTEARVRPAARSRLTAARIRERAGRTTWVVVGARGVCRRTRGDTCPGEAGARGESVRCVPERRTRGVAQGRGTCRPGGGHGPNAIRPRSSARRGGHRPIAGRRLAR
jgi:hypothetical protein